MFCLLVCFVLFVFFPLLVFLNRVSLCSSGHLEFALKIMLASTSRDPPVSTSQVLGLKVCATTVQLRNDDFLSDCFELY